MSSTTILTSRDRHSAQCELSVGHGYAFLAILLTPNRSRNQATRCLDFRCHQKATPRVQHVRTAVIELYTRILVPSFSEAITFIEKIACRVSSVACASNLAQLTAMKLPGRYASVIKAVTFVVLESFLAICATSRITLLSKAVSPVDVTMLPMSRRLPAVRSTDVSLRIFSNFELFSHAFERKRC